MTREDFMRRREALGFPATEKGDAQFAKALGVSKKSAQRMRLGAVKVSTEVALLMLLFNRDKSFLHACKSFGADAITRRTAE
jgi:hypothetical protein